MQHIADILLSDEEESQVICEIRQGEIISIYVWVANVYQEKKQNFPRWLNSCQTGCSYGTLVYNTSSFKSSSFYNVQK